MFHWGVLVGIKVGVGMKVGEGAGIGVGTGVGIGVGGFANGLVLGIASGIEKMPIMATANVNIQDVRVGFCDLMSCAVVGTNVVWSGKRSIAQAKWGIKHLFVYGCIEFIVG